MNPLGPNASVSAGIVICGSGYFMQGQTARFFAAMNGTLNARLRRLGDIAAKARARGAGWLTSRMVREIRNPETGIGKRLRRLLSPAYGAVASLGIFLPLVVFRGVGANRSTLFLFYDLDVAPITFNAVDSLVYAELIRRQKDLERIHVVIVPGKQNGLRDEMATYEAVVDRDRRMWRVHNLIVPLTTLLPSCDGLTICHNRIHAGMMRLLALGRTVPIGFWNALPSLLSQRWVFNAARQGVRVLPALSSSPQAIKYVQQWLASRAKGRRVVVISLREYGYMPERNSNRTAWTAFARSLDPAKYVAVFVHDTDVAMIPSPLIGEGLCVFEPGPWNLALRSALYERAWLNIGLQHGPMELCWYNARCRYVLFMPVGVSIDTDESHLRREGFMRGENLPFAARYQRLVWSPDSLENIQAVFAETAAELEQAEVAGEIERREEPSLG